MDIVYRDLKKYKYQLLQDYDIIVDIKPLIDIKTEFIILNTAGRLIIKKWYAWDGASGPTIDTKSFMRGSLVHDALYQLMREAKIGTKHRDYADRLLQRLCIEDGMYRWRAWYVYHSVKMFAKKHAMPTK